MPLDCQQNDKQQMDLELRLGPLLQFRQEKLHKHWHVELWDSKTWYGDYRQQVCCVAGCEGPRVNGKLGLLPGAAR